MAVNGFPYGVTASEVTVDMLILQQPGFIAKPETKPVARNQRINQVCQNQVLIPSQVRASIKAEATVSSPELAYYDKV